jgi:hypothetical protein
MDKNFIITVKQRDVSLPRLYRLRASLEPTTEQLIELGADIYPPRLDQVNVDEVSGALYNAVNARWLRP